MGENKQMSNKNTDYCKEFRFSILDDTGNTLTMVAVPETSLLKMSNNIEELKTLVSEMMVTKDILTMDDVVELTGLSKSYVYKLVSRREISYYKSSGGKMTYFKRKDVEKWMLDTRCSSSSEMESVAAKYVLSKTIKK